MSRFASQRFYSLVKYTTRTISKLRSSTTILKTSSYQNKSNLARNFNSTSPSQMASKTPFIEAVKSRRTFYALNKEAPISDDAIVELVKVAIESVPSSFNVQSARLVVLLNKEHDEFWNLIHDTFKPRLAAEKFAPMEAKINGFKGAYATILFFEDPEPIKVLQAKFANYKDHFPQWSEHTSAMHQYVLWTGLEAEGFGANLQHYNPIIDDAAKARWNVPKDWSLKAQLVFGGRAGGPAMAVKPQQPLESRLFVYGK